MFTLFVWFCSIDGTYSSGLGRFVNDDYKRPNRVIKKTVTDINDVSLCLFALRDIRVGDELRYDYGPDVEGGMPWRLQAVVKFEESQCQYRPHTAVYESAMHINMDSSSSGVFSRPKRVVEMAQSKKTGEKIAYCECCEVYYRCGRLKEHLSSARHTVFAQMSSNYRELDAAIATLPQLSNLLDFKPDDKPCEPDIDTSTLSSVSDDHQNPIPDEPASTSLSVSTVGQNPVVSALMELDPQVVGNEVLDQTAEIPVVPDEPAISSSTSKLLNVLCNL